ncbi:caspase activity and apoptosis inhibitor 1 [Alosa pseudoharengus]|uniref:caspase activity and apoptosis inhibitor 1 n=1 Tax=Alosa pseudoharengus TaxID=34774 RepID=UPI003F893856
MLGKKSLKEKKRRHSQGESREVDRKRRSTESSVEDAKEEPEPAEAPAEEPSDTEEGGLDLSVPFKPISAYVSDRQEMLEQCFRVLGENKLKKMLPDELKDVPFEEIKKLCGEQLEQLSPNNLLEILEGREVSDPDAENKSSIAVDSQQDNNVDSTSSVKDNSEVEELKQSGGSGEESDVLSINADADDSDIEGPKEEKSLEAEEESAAVPPGTPPAQEEEEEGQKKKMMKVEQTEKKEDEPRLELQQDIERSVSEILALSVPAEPPPPPPPPPPRAAQPAQAQGDFPAAPAVAVAAAVAQPSAQQLELLELEMRARAIKALMKANDTKKQGLAP